MKRRWIIKSGLLVITFTFALLQFNCEAFEEKDIVETIEQHLEITPKIDRTIDPKYVFGVLLV